MLTFVTDWELFVPQLGGQTGDRLVVGFVLDVVASVAGHLHAR